MVAMVIVISLDTILGDEVELRIMTAISLGDIIDWVY